MKLTLPLPKGYSPHTLLQRCGYAFVRDPRAQQQSYVRRLGSYFYPRFHIYVSRVSDTSLDCTLHLDMKQTSHIQGKSHSGEYDGDQVTAEVERVRRMIAWYSKGA